MLRLRQREAELIGVCFEDILNPSVLVGPQPTREFATHMAHMAWIFEGRSGKPIPASCSSLGLRARVAQKRGGVVVKSF